jgi:hypothetical protein
VVADVTFGDGNQQGIAMIDMSPAIPRAASGGGAWRLEVGSDIKNVSG